jgi:6-phospho-beta-glucosidase
MRLTVVGGGSTYTPELIDGVLDRHDRLPLTEIVLVDINARRVEIVGRFAQRMAARAALPIQISWTDDLAAAVTGSSFVVSQMRVGTQAARHRDEMLGREFGLIGQETVGIGGFAKALRTVPVALDIARTIEQVAPEAVLLNFTNPAGLVTEALRRHAPDVTTIGLCNVPWNIRTDIAHGMHVDFDDVQIDSVGLNHLSWVRSVRVNGTDVTDEVVEGYAREVERDAAESGDPEWDPDSVRLMRAIPNSYLRYYYETRMMLAHQSDSPTRASEVMQIETELLKQYEDAGLDKKPDELMQRGGAYYSDSAVELMADIHNDAGTTHVVNVRNDGAIPGMDPSVVMEIPALIDRRGATALAGDAMRSDIDSLVRTVKDFELLTIEAAVSGDEDSALRALVTNPLGPDMSAAREVWRRLKEENQGLLGKFG